MGTLEILASVLTAVMGINAYFLKGVYSDMQFLKVELAKLITNHDNTKQDAADNAKEIYRLRERVHSLEGSQAQILKWLDSRDNNGA